jgi:alcohol dehydrogenase class IV
MDSISTYIWPGQVHFGPGAAGLAGREAKALDGRSVFIVADPGVVAAGLLEPITTSLSNLPAWRGKCATGSGPTPMATR